MNHALHFSPDDNFVIMFLNAVGDRLEPAFLKLLVQHHGLTVMMHEENCSLPDCSKDLKNPHHRLGGCETANVKFDHLLLPGFLIPRSG